MTAIRALVEAHPWVLLVVVLVTAVVTQIGRGD